MVPAQKTKMSSIPLALAELIDRLSTEEKRELVQVLNWQELQELRLEEISQGKANRVGDPKVYVATTKSGLSLELPLACVPAFVGALPSLLSAQDVEIFVQNGEGSEETHCAASDLETWLSRHTGAWQEGTMMIELGPHTLISGGGGCLSLALENVPPAVRKEIAHKALKLCGYDHVFKQDHFSAIVWDDQLEVSG